MVISRRRMQELENISCIREFKGVLESMILSGELDLSENTVSQYCYEVELFHRQSGIPYDTEPPKTKTLDWKRIAENKYAKKTQCKKYSAINHYLKHLHKLDWSIPLPRHAKREHEPQTLTETQVLDMVKFHEKNHKHTKAMIIYIGYMCGCRAEALINIKLSDIEHNARTILLTRTKGNKSRYVPLSQNSWAKLKEYIDKHRPLPNEEQNKDYLFIQEWKRTKAGNSYLRYAVKKAAFALEIPTSVYPHLLRHSRIRELRIRGYSWEKVMALTGHSDIRSLSDYIHAETVEGLQEALDADEGPSNASNLKTPEQMQLEMLQKENEKLRLELEVLHLKMQGSGIPNQKNIPKSTNIGYM